MTAKLKQLYLHWRISQLILLIRLNAATKQNTELASVSCRLHQAAYVLMMLIFIFYMVLVLNKLDVVRLERRLDKEYRA